MGVFDISYPIVYKPYFVTWLFIIILSYLSAVIIPLTTIDEIQTMLSVVLNFIVSGRCF